MNPSVYQDPSFPSIQTFLKLFLLLLIDKCQGGDATLEELNKDSKSWLKMAGIPTKEQWLQVFRNMDGLNKVFLFLKKASK